MTQSWVSLLSLLIATVMIRTCILVVVALVAVCQVTAFRPSARKALGKTLSKVNMARGEAKVIDPNETEEGKFVHASPLIIECTSNSD